MNSYFCDHLKHGIVSQIRVVVAIFVPSGDAEDLRRQHLPLFVRDIALVARIRNGFINSADQVELSIDFPQQKKPGIGRNGASLAVDVNRLPAKSAEHWPIVV